jgi:hypothetical protein
MEASSVSNVGELSLEQRQVVESMVGRALDSQEVVVVAIMRFGREPTAAEKARARARLERVFDQADRYGHEQGISADEADKTIDAAVEDVRSRTS